MPTSSAISRRLVCSNPWRRISRIAASTIAALVSGRGDGMGHSRESTDLGKIQMRRFSQTDHNSGNSRSHPGRPCLHCARPPEGDPADSMWEEQPSD